MTSKSRAIIIKALKSYKHANEYITQAMLDDPQWEDPMNLDQIALRLALSDALDRAMEEIAVAQ